MLGPATEEELIEGTFGSYREMRSNEQVEQLDSQESGFVDNDVEAGQELLLPTVTKYGLVRRYKSNVRKKIQKRRIENEDTLMGHFAIADDSKYSKVEIEQAKSDLEKFFRNAGTVDVGSLKASQAGGANRTMNFLKEIIEEEFPAHDDQVPTGKELVYFGEMQSNKALFSPGDWVEIEGKDMVWRLDMITRAIKQAPDDWDWNATENEGKEPRWKFNYNAGLERNIKEEDLRAPEAGLKLLFGCRPWVWQQWAILKVEEKLRFQEGHQNDFATKDIQKLATDLWDQWLEHPANIEFSQLFYDDRIGDRGRRALVNHIQKPFQLIDLMGEENKEWDFTNDDDINVFTYVSLHGSGLLIPFLVLAVQIAIPIVLLMEATTKARCVNGEDLPAEEFLPKIMSLVIFVYYMYSIIPDTYYNFFNVAGAGDSVFSRLLSIRRMVWMQGDDSLLQMVGFKLDMYMNTAYQSLLMMLNIFVIINTAEVIEIVLNALAFIFIARIDEDIAQSGWYDPDKRWLTAGAMETAMQGVIRLRVLSSPRLFSKEYEIHEELLLNICNRDTNLLCNHDIAKKDYGDPLYMTMEERINHMCSKVAQDTKNRNAIQEYKKKKVHFGYLESSLHFFFGRSYSAPLFERFTAWRTWSRWEKVLFLSPVPILDDIFTEDFHGQIVLTKKVDDINLDLPNFYPNESRSNIRVFVSHIRDVLLFREVIPALKPVCSFRYVGRFLFRLGDLLVNWIFYAIQIFFPLYLMSSLFEVIYNIIFMKCLIFNPIEIVYEWVAGMIRNQG